ncbi:MULTISPECIES: hypothetical protein [unclassified Campylobacter]|uniref:hypothetical protein n=1 Tax=unclassified Campylobacter TaxID=2593542 RepID=UPI003D34FB0A
MKQAKILIEHIYKNPLYKNLSKAYECACLLKVMQPHHRNLIAFCYVSGDTLHCALKHPLGLQELRHNSNIISIKSLLKIIATKAKNDGKISIFEGIHHIKFFVLHGVKKPQQTQQNTQIFRPLRAKGEFENSCKDEKLYEKFEALRAIIKAKNGIN